MHGRDDYLFSSNDWVSLEAHLNTALAAEVAGIDADRLLNTDPQAMASYLRERFTLYLPAIRNEDVSIDQREVDIDVSNRFGHGFDGYGPKTVKGVEYEVHAPFEGDGNLFKTQPTTYSSNRPQASVRGQTLVFSLRDIQLDNKRVEQGIDGFLASVQQHLGWLGESTSQWNARLPATVGSLVASRRQKLIADRTAAAGLKYKMRDRPGAARTYTAPEVKRKITPSMPPASSAPWKPEPVLDIEQYEHILEVITNAAKTMERSPDAFKTMGEEDLRTQFLFQLNGHYQGQATGETFNKQGKTDILIRSQDKNIFIGECKFWGGAKALTETIDQLLGYTSWRDTKVAVIIFNRNKNFTSVLGQIRQTVEAHPHCKRFLSAISDSQFRFTFTQRDDAQREMTLTVMAFDVPQP